MRAIAKFKWLIVFADGSTLRIRGNPATKEEARAAYLRQFKKKILPRGSKIVYGNPADYDYAASKVVKLDGAPPTRPSEPVTAGGPFHIPTNLPKTVYGVLGEEAHDFSILGYAMKSNLPESYAGFPVGIYKLVAVAEMRVAKQVHVDITEEFD